MSGLISLKSYTQGAAFTLSGVSYDVTGLPNWVSQINIKFADLSTDGTSIPILQIGDSGGMETNGYNGSVSLVTNAPSVIVTSLSTGLAITNTTFAASLLNGEISLSLIDPVTNLWMMTMEGSFQGGGITIQSSASKALSGVLTQLRFTTFGGADSFDSGTVSISWQ